MTYILKVFFLLFIAPYILFFAAGFIFAHWELFLISIVIFAIFSIIYTAIADRKAKFKAIEKEQKELNRARFIQQKIDSYRQAQQKKEPEPLFKATGTATFIPAAGGEEQKINIIINIK
ncbi:hypothetical protein ACWA5Z_11505 [Testudinibacter sp. P80/BLE/0925]|uniref:hypothetical protein n=1 Tax=Testudinibacter sp. TW-1 TaxID=3417757 RepID=UPI003D365FC7